jgi:hypothetical protein
LLNKPLKIAVVGGGIAGLYCAWELGKRRNNSVTLFEFLDHLGGRIETLQLDEFYAECGPMRFELAIQPLFHQLMKDLGLDGKFEDFSKTDVVPVNFPRYELENNERYDDGRNASSLDLLRYGLFRIFNKKEEDRKLRISQVVGRETLENFDKETSRKDFLKTRSRIEEFADNLTPEDFHNYRTTYELDEQPLHKLGIWNALARVLSPQAILKLREIGTFYHLIPENPSASEWSIFWLRLSRSDANLSTISDGVQTCTKKLEENLKNSRNVELITGAGVRKIDYGETEGKIHLTISRSHAERPDLNLEFDHVILALPKIPLLNLIDLFPDEIRNYINGVIAFPLLKAFITIRKKWWKEKPQPQKGAPVVPTREIHYFELSEMKKVEIIEKDKERRKKLPESEEEKINLYLDRAMIMLYTDRPATTYWSPYVQLPHQKVQADKPKELKHELAERIYDIIKHERRREHQEFIDIKTEYFIDKKSPIEKMPDYAKKWDFNGEYVTESDSNFTQEYYKLFEHVIDSSPENDAEREKAANTALKKIENNVMSFAIRDWSKLPFGAANHAWAPGIKVPDALERLKGFSLMGRPGNNNLHICGEAYSDYQGFIEGALRSAQQVLDFIYQES